MSYAAYLFAFDGVTAPHWMFMPMPCSQHEERISCGILVMECARRLLTNESLENISVGDEGITALHDRISSELETGVLQEMVVQPAFEVKLVEKLEQSYIDSLEKGEKLRGEVVHTYIRLLANFVNTRAGRSVVGVLHDLPVYTNGKWPELFGQAPRIVAAHMKIILIPKCAKDHWQLLVLDRELAQIRLFCSMGWTMDLDKDSRVSLSSTL
jgi:hypothetical protein